MATAQTIVEYRLLPGDPGYRVGSDGTVQSCLGRRGSLAYVPTDTWKPLALVPDNGYRVAAIRGKPVAVHRLVLLAFVGPCPEGLECCHGDDDRSNNALSNLRWGTPKDNAADSYRNGRQPRGETSPRSKLTDDAVRAIRAAHAAGRTPTELSREYGVTGSAIHCVVTRFTWKHVT